MKTVFFSCTRGFAEGTLLYRSLKRLGIDSFEIIEHNTTSLSARYNRFLDAHAGEDLLAVFVHDDVAINDMDVLLKLEIAAKDFDVIGIVGASRMNLRAEDPFFSWGMLHRDDLSGAVEHTVQPGVTYWSTFGVVPKRCMALDGLLLGVVTRKLGPIRFDEQFAFHLYDLDFCLSCNKAKLALGTTNIYCHHTSPGNAETDGYRSDWKSFSDKWLR